MGEEGGSNDKINRCATSTKSDNGGKTKVPRRGGNGGEGGGEMTEGKSGCLLRGYRGGEEEGESDCLPSKKKRGSGIGGTWIKGEKRCP